MARGWGTLMPMNTCTRTIAGLVAFASAAIAIAAPILNVGSKRFTESYILGEILKQTAQSAGETSTTQPGFRVTRPSY